MRTATTKAQAAKAEQGNKITSVQTRSYNGLRATVGLSSRVRVP
jgi:hypothetical protein